MVHLALRMHCNWPNDHATDHSSIGLNRLTIQLVFNEVSLLTFSEGTHGFDVTVPKNYLNNLLYKNQKFTDQDPGTTQPEGNSIYLNYKFIIFINSQNCPCVGGKFPV